MSKLILILAVLVPASAWGQQASEVPKAEVFAGYSYLNIDTNDLTSRQNAHGWETSVSGNFNKWLAAEFDVSGHYKTYSGVRVTDYSYLAGPRFNFRPLFAHALFGGDHLTGLSLSQDSFASVVGGGVQVPLTRLLSFRVSGDYALSRHNILGGPSVTQNNFRASVGIVFNFWGTREEGTRANVPKTSPSGESSAPSSGERPTSQPATDTVVLSLGVTGYAADDGFKVTSVRDGSPAAQIFVRPGDVILRIDDKRVQSGKEIDAIVAANATGRIKVFGLTRTALGMITFEREVNVR